MIAALISIAFYLAAGITVGTRLLHHQGPNVRLAGGLGILAILFHGVSLYQGIWLEPGQNMSMTNVASIIAMLISISMMLASITLPNAILLPVVFGFSAFILAIGQLLPDTHIMHIDVEPALLVHITLALLAYGCLMIALLYALQLSLINHRLKHKRAAMINSSLPPLMAVELILFKLLLTGTGLLTVSLISGFAFLPNMLDKEHAHKTLLSVLAWIVFCVVLVGHKKWGWRGKSVVFATVVGSALLTLAYFGSRFVREVILN